MDSDRFTLPLSAPTCPVEVTQNPDRRHWSFVSLLLLLKVTFLESHRTWSFPRGFSPPP